jgi:hypothetical protein
MLRNLDFDSRLDYDIFFQVHGGVEVYLLDLCASKLTILISIASMLSSRL